MGGLERLEGVWCCRRIGSLESLEGVWEFHFTITMLQEEEVLRRGGVEYCGHGEIISLTSGHDRDELIRGKVRV